MFTQAWRLIAASAPAATLSLPTLIALHRGIAPRLQKMLEKIATRLPRMQAAQDGCRRLFSVYDSIRKFQDTWIIHVFPFFFKLERQVPSRESSNGPYFSPGFIARHALFSNFKRGIDAGRLHLMVHSRVKFLGNSRARNYSLVSLLERQQAERQSTIAALIIYPQDAKSPSSNFTVHNIPLIIHNVLPDIFLLIRAERKPIQNEDKQFDSQGEYEVHQGWQAAHQAGSVFLFQCQAAIVW
ncbi:hypothetical protein C8J57DRAFT_1222347 [Mycena rebaudengoi]|nr:hypothetical protein C8J57DRAFT_1222347 [Mycena rebaudengoi]